MGVATVEEGRLNTLLLQYVPRLGIGGSVLCRDKRDIRLVDERLFLCNGLVVPLE